MPDCNSLPPGVADASADGAAGLGSDILWGAQSIGEEIGVSARKAYYLLENGLIPARKVGRDWCSRRSALRRHFAFSGEAA